MWQRVGINKMSIIVHSRGRGGRNWAKFGPSSCWTNPYQNRKDSWKTCDELDKRTIRENVNVSAQVQQLSEKASDLASENETLKVRNTERKRKIGMLEDEQEKLVKRNTYRLKVW